MIREDDATLVALYVTFRSPSPDHSERVLAAFRDLHLIGAIIPGEDDGSGALTTVVAAVRDRGLVVWSSDGEVATTPAEHVAQTLAARLGAAIILDIADDVSVSVDDTAWTSEATSDPTGLQDAGDHRDTRTLSRELCIVAGVLALAADRRPELAIQLGGGLHVIPDGERTVLLPDAGIHSFSWPPAQRPVLTLAHSPHMLVLSLFLPLTPRAGTRRDRQLARVFPDAVLLWQPEPQLSPVPPRGPALALQGALFSRRREDARADADRLVAHGGWEALGVDADSVRALADGVLRSDTLDRLVAAMRLDDAATRDGAPDEVRTAGIVAFLRGDVDAHLPAEALHIPKASLRSVLLASVLEEPQGTSLWSRWRRLPHRRPRLAASLTGAEAVAASLLLVAAIAPPQSQPLTSIQWIIAGIFVIDVVSDTVLLIALRRRRKRGEMEKPRSE